MVGLGETLQEIMNTLQDLRDHGCRLVTIGQYLQPSKQHLMVEKYYSPEQFNALADYARSIGFSNVASGPFVRSSYQAEHL